MWLVQIHPNQRFSTKLFSFPDQPKKVVIRRTKRKNKGKKKRRKRKPKRLVISNVCLQTQFDAVFLIGHLVRTNICQTFTRAFAGNANESFNEIIGSASVENHRSRTYSTAVQKNILLVVNGDLCLSF